MNKRKLHNQKLPKAWQKKKKASKFRHEKTPRSPKPTIGKPVKSNKFLARKPSAWKLPGIVFISAFVIMILIIPTLIVLPDKHEGQAQIKTDNPVDQAEAKDAGAGEDEDKAASLSAGDSPFSVEVMRANSETTEDVPLETYVSRVVAAEMPVEFEPEALKAQSLAARTYIVDMLLQQDQNNGDDEQAVTDTTDNQVYRDETQLQKQWGKDYDKNMQKITQAVAETKGEILTYDDDPIFPAFFSTSNGYTENSEDYWENKLPYLRSVESPWDEKSPKFLDQQVVTIDEAEQELGVTLSGDLNADVSRTDGNRVQTVTIGGKEFSGKNIREIFGLRSSDFTMEQKNDHLIFTTKGFGHGIGMSQYGANGMAKDGKNYQDIVKYYYQDVEIEEVTDTAPTLVAK